MVVMSGALAVMSMASELISHGCHGPVFVVVVVNRCTDW